MVTMKSEDAVICVLYDTSLVRVGPDGSGRFFGGSDEWKKRRILVQKGNRLQKAVYRMAAEWDFKMESQQEAVSIMDGLNLMLQEPPWSQPQ